MVDAGSGPGRGTEAGEVDRGALKLIGLLLLFGFFINLTVTMLWHPAGEENDHPEIFTEYANADGWVLTHFGQFLGVIMGVAGLFLLARLVTTPGRLDALARLAGASFLAAGVCYGILQAVDGVALKYATEAWVDAAGPAKDLRFGDAETVRWTEWGVQSYFRIFFGLGLVLVGAAIANRRLLAGWLGWLAAIAGAISIAIGIDVGYAGLASDFQDVAGPLFQLVLLVFLVGILVVGFRDPNRSAPT
jgi:cbb3-type cytochrome oxidase subunit 3